MQQPLCDNGRLGSMTNGVFALSGFEGSPRSKYDVNHKRSTVANSFSKQYCEENRQSTKQKPAPDLWSPVGAGKDHRYGGAKSGKQLIDHGHLHPDGCLAWANGAWHSRPYSASTRTNIPFQTIAVDRSRGSG